MQKNSKRRRRVGSITQEDVNRYSAQIYNQARKGTPVNPGVPIALANLLVAQARHETGNFTSNAFTRHNNAFGYSYVEGGRYQSGPGLIADNGQPVANYARLEDSVNEIVDWIYRRKKEGKFPDLNTITDPQQYATLLKGSNYYGDTIANYWAGLKSFFRDLTGTAGGGSAAAAVFIAVGVVAFIYRRQLFGL